MIFNKKHRGLAGVHREGVSSAKVCRTRLRHGPIRSPLRIILRLSSASMPNQGHQCVTRIACYFSVTVEKRCRAWRSLAFRIHCRCVF
jgi:hypothetical protein